MKAKTYNAPRLPMCLSATHPPLTMGEENLLREAMEKERDPDSVSAAVKRKYAESSGCIWDFLSLQLQGDGQKLYNSIVCLNK